MTELLSIGQVLCQKVFLPAVINDYHANYLKIFVNLIRITLILSIKKACCGFIVNNKSTASLKSAISVNLLTL